MINVESTIISQYGESSSITQLVRGIDNYLDPRADIENFYNLVWNIDTAETWGLDVWGKIVDMPRYVDIHPTVPVPPGTEGGSFYIPDEDYRGYILLKAAANISNCSSPSINRLITNKFKNVGTAYVADTGAMTMLFIFYFPLSYWEESLFLSGKIFPKTTGVKANVLVQPNEGVFGFFGSGLQPFNQAPFVNDQFLDEEVFGFESSNLNPFNQAPFTSR